jgi:hypothetical protein
VPGGVDLLVGDHDASAMICKRVRDRSADPASAAHHEGDLTGQIEQIVERASLVGRGRRRRRGRSIRTRIL